jgi:glycosyltransferase involved in cell wall biosynthesis
VPHDLEGVPAKLFRARSALPGTGFAGLAAPAMVLWFIRNRRSFDVVHIHLARDLVTLPLALIALCSKIPTVVQTHGMIDASSKWLARLLDAAVTRRVLRAADSVLYLTVREKADLTGVAGGIALVYLPNGVPLPDRLAHPESMPPELLFLARLHPRKRAVMFVRAAIDLLDEGLDARFAIVGPDEGEGQIVRSLINGSGHGDRLRWDGPIEPGAVLDRLQAASVYVLPAVDEPFPMAVLEAMSVGVPVVVTTSCGLSDMIERTGSGSVIEDTDISLRLVMAQLVSDPARREAQGRSARQAVVSELGMTAVREKLEAVYQEAMDASVVR